MLSQHATQVGDGPVNAIDPGFEIPSQYRWNLGISHTLPGDVLMTVDAIISHVKDEVLWKDIRLVQTASRRTAGRATARRPMGAAVRRSRTSC